MDYTYDQLQRLKTADSDGSASYPAWALGWGYDRYGNQLTQTGVTGIEHSFDVDANTNRILRQTGAPNTYGYDSAGNLTVERSAPESRYGYDAENRLEDAGWTSWKYKYDPMSRRWQKREIATGVRTIFIYDGYHLLAEYDSAAAAGSPTAEYVYSGGQVIAKAAGGSTTYFQADHLSVRLLTNSAGAVLGSRGHYPFGETWYSSGANTNRAFTNYLRDDGPLEGFNDYANFREMGGRMGRFLQVDPIDGTVQIPQSWNRYAYVWNDPVNATDPLGLLQPIVCGIDPNRPECGLDRFALEHLLCFLGICGGEIDSIDRGGGGGGGGGTVRAIGKAVLNVLVCTQAQDLINLAKNSGTVAGIGFGGSAGAGISLGIAAGASGIFVADPQGNVGFALSGSVAPGYGVIGAGMLGGIQFLISNATAIDQLKGPYGNVGLGGADGFGIGIDIAVSGSTRTAIFTLGAGAGGLGKATTIGYTGVSQLARCGD